METYDIIIIGSGPGGYVSAIRASQLGLKTAIIEKESLGGICLNWGCIPTKALLKSAQVFEYIKHAKDYGINVKNYDKDFDAVINRSRDVAQNMNKGVDFLMKKNKIDVYIGEGLLGKNKKVKITTSNEEKEIEGEHIIIATGARTREIKSIPIDGKKIIGYREAMTLKKQPKKLCIIGSGAIGIEFAYFYNSMGTDVTLIEFQNRIAPLEDDEISSQLEKSFKKMGINIMINSKVIGIDNSGKNPMLNINNGEKEFNLESEVVLSAIGVKSNIENLGLEEVGVAIDNDKILVNDFYETNIPGYYAIGDITKGQAFAHVASAEGILCVEKISGIQVEPINYNNIPGCTYCHPEIASVGYTEKQATEKGFEIKVGMFPFSASGKAKASGSSDGFVKVIFDAKYGEWLGCHMIGSGVTEMIAEAVIGRKLETTGHEILKSVHPHPTMSEAIMEAVANAYDETIHL